MLNEFAAKSSFDLLILGKVTVEDGYEWWPILAIEIDGLKHDIDDGQKLNDFKKNRICSEALLPLLRIQLSKASTNLGRQAMSEVVEDNSNENRIELDFLRHMIAVGLDKGSIYNQRKLQVERRRSHALLLRIKVLQQNGHSSTDAIQIAINEQSDSDLNTQDWCDEMADQYAAQETKAFQERELEAEYKAMYGKPPKVEISVRPDGILSGSLGKHKLLPMKAYASFIKDRNEMEQHLREFGRLWLFHRALYSKQG